MADGDPSFNVDAAALTRPMNYTVEMNFEWDTVKSDCCFENRGFDFAFASRAFFDPHRIIAADNRYNYGEERFQLIGKIGGRLFVVIYTPRHNSIRIISARKANHREVQFYEDSTHEN